MHNWDTAGRVVLRFLTHIDRPANYLIDQLDKELGPNVVVEVVPASEADVGVPNTHPATLDVLIYAPYHKQPASYQTPLETGLSGLPAITARIDDRSAFNPDYVQTLATRISARLPPAHVDLVVVGRMSDAPSLASGVAELVEMGVGFDRCWGSGTGGSPLTLAAFIGARPDLGVSAQIRAQGLRDLGTSLAEAALSPLDPGRIWRRRIGGWSLPASWVESSLLPKIGTAIYGVESPQARTGELGALTVGELGAWETDPDRYRPGDWLQLITMDLEARHPVRMPEHFDDIGSYSQSVTVADLLRMAMGGLDGTPPVKITDGMGREREITQYPGFWLPWSLEGEQAEVRSGPVMALLPDQEARESSYWWGMPVGDMLKREHPEGWIVVELPASTDRVPMMVQSAVNAAIDRRIALTDEAALVDLSEAEVATP